MTHISTKKREKAARRDKRKKGVKKGVKKEG